MIFNILEDKRKIIILLLIIILFCAVFFAVISGNSELSPKTVLNIILYKLTNFSFEEKAQKYG